MAKRSDEDAARELAGYFILADKTSQAAGHVAAGAALCELILRDPRWADEFASWALELKMFPAAHDLREAPDPATRESVEKRLGDVFTALEGTGVLEGKVTAFVEKTLRLSYPWLPEYLHVGFQQDVLAYAYREDRSTLFELRTAELVQPAPRISVRFRTKLGETWPEISARWRALNAEVEQTLAAAVSSPATSDGDRMPKNCGEYIREWVSWFYRAHTKASSVRALAKEHHRQRHRTIFEKVGDCKCRMAPDGGKRIAPDDRPTIYAGIRKARALLALDVIAGEDLPDPAAS